MAETPSPVPDRGLPPVTPPSARFIAQLFVVPSIIVLIAVLLLMAFRFLMVSSNDAPQFLQAIDSDNEHIRWRGANDLAAFLQRNEPDSIRLKADPKFALDLVERLERAYERYLVQEKAVHEAIRGTARPEDHEQEWLKIRKSRDAVTFLISATADVQIPVAVPVLCQIAEREQGFHLKSNRLLQRQALWALANLGNHLREFPKLPHDQRAAIREVLERQSQPPANRALAAVTARHYLGLLENNAEITPQPKIVDATLKQLSQSDDVFVRKQVAMACCHWPGQLTEAILVTLSRDDGHGTTVTLSEND
jgi:hypothetical protein